MATVGTTFCSGCGQDVTNRSCDRRSLSTEASKPVVDLLKEFLEGASTTEDETQMDIDDVIHPQAKMCRKCYAAFERFISLRNKIEDNLNAAVDVLAPSSTKRIKVAAAACAGSHPASRVTSARTSKQDSPNVTVSYY